MNYALKLWLLLLLILVFDGCNEALQNNPTLETEYDASEEEGVFISAADISAYPEIAQSGLTFYGLDGIEKPFLDILKENGVNTIRLKLWVNPQTENGSFEQVKSFSEELKSHGFKTWITLHYSDTWADPGHQETPIAWQNVTLETLKAQVFDYTQDVVEALKPDFIQIGNEINSGFLHPFGEITTQEAQFVALLGMAVSAVRTASESTKIILQYAGIENSEWFFDQVSSVDYDIIGLSFYPIWHGKSLSTLKSSMQRLSETHSKEIIIAETAYPFTLEWNDWTNNIVGLDEQLILPEFPASAKGQLAFITEIKNLTKELPLGIGFCYWGAELVSWKGPQATNASPWENQALFDFENKALPVLTAFGNE